MKIIVAQDCNCKSAPNFTDEKKALKMYLESLRADEHSGHMYWAVHYKGKHILSIEDDSADEIL